MANPKVVLVAAVTVLAACGGGDEEPARPLVLRRAPAEVGTTLDLDIPLDRSGLFVFDQWPRACDLLTDADIKAVLPQTAKVERTSEDQDINIIGDTPRSVTVADAKCSFELDLSAAGMAPDEPGQGSPTLWVSIDSAGMADVVEQNFSGEVNEPILVPNGQCYVPRGLARVDCRKGPLSFTISSAFPHQDLGDHRWTDRYLADGETTTFSAGIETDEAGTKEFTTAEAFRRDALDVELAKIVLAKY